MAFRPILIILLLSLSQINFTKSWNKIYHFASICCRTALRKLNVQLHSQNNIHQTLISCQNENLGVFLFFSVCLIFSLLLIFGVLLTSFNQACRGYEISHPYPYLYPQIFAWISMDISISIDAYPCVHVVTKFPQSTCSRGKRGPYPKDKNADIPLLKLLLLFGTV